MARGAAGVIYSRFSGLLGSGHWATACRLAAERRLDVVIIPPDLEAFSSKSGQSICPVAPRQPMARALLPMSART